MFGHGLSYTTFDVTNLRLSSSSVSRHGRVKATVDVENPGDRAGDEVVQLYIRDHVSSVTRPVLELAGFERVTLAPGEERTVTFTIGPEALAIVGTDMKRVVEPGRFEVLVGTSSTNLTAAALEVVAR